MLMGKRVMTLMSVKITRMAVNIYVSITMALTHAAAMMDSISTAMSAYV
jgi:hypothetical protein